MNIIASDFDGTLCRGRITEEDKEAIARWRAAGNLFGVVTGRMYDGAAWIHILGVEMDFTIGSSGGIIVAPDQSIIDEVTGDASFLAEAALLTREMGGKHMVLGCGKDQLWLKFREEGWEKQLEILRGWKSFSQFSAPFADDDQAAEFVQVLGQRYGNFCNPLQNGGNVDVPPLGIDKPAGIRRYVELMGLSPEHIITVGDNLNDMAMIRAYEGYAMANGRAEVKFAARGVVETIAQLIGLYMK